MIAVQVQETPQVMNLFVPFSDGSIDPDDVILKTSTAILSVISRYRLDAPKSTNEDQTDAASPIRGPGPFLSLIYQSVASHIPIRMCLPAFPFKSPNTVDKVLGRLPDKAEEIALAHLNGMCLAVADIYEPGAQLVIVSDGLVYNDLLGVPDREVWAYGQALRALSLEKGFKNIEFSRLQDLVHLDNLPAKLDEMTYVANATNFRRTLLNTFGKFDWDATQEISNNQDTCLTYTGYLKFLRADLRHTYLVGNDRSRSKYKSGIEYIAKQMLQRGAAFAKAVETRFGASHIRLSIHPSTSGTKLSIRTLPSSGRFTTPWHCSVAIDLNGDIHSAHRSDFDNNPKYELINGPDGHPSYYREKSPLWTWDNNNTPITVDPLYPAGLMIRPRTGPNTLSIEHVDAPKVRALAELNSPVILRGFSNSGDRDLYVNKAHELGTPQPWKWGLVLEVKDIGIDPVNNASNTFALSSEWMPFHYDGVFKTKPRVLEDGTEVVEPNPPQFQFFTSVTPSPQNTGFTLFTPSRLLLRNLPPSTLPLSRLTSLTWSVTTASFDSPTITSMPLITAHPTTKTPCLRYHEPWPSSKTAFDPIHVGIEGVTDQESDEICAVLDEALKDRRNCYWHAWEKGDMVVADNIAGLHTRTDFKSGTERELWRVHFD